MLRHAVYLVLGSAIMALACGCACDRAQCEPVARESSEQPPTSENREQQPAKVEPPQAPRASTRVDINPALATFAPGWMAKNCGAAMSPGIRDEMGRKNVLVTHPLSETVPCILGQRVDVLPNKQTTLHLVVGHHPEGDWVLAVTADRELVRKVIGKETSTNGWVNVDVDLTEYAGRFVTIQLINAANGWSYEGAYWAKIEIE
ncbi:MAG: hypothetical protein GXY55_00815 [Phycisphaerae bacterium]|nr:hypothetical protein [Phycisphaerae bacterium]